MPFERLIDFAKDADVFICEATFTSELKERSIETMHTTAGEAAEMAKKANVGILVLTHFSARYNDLTGHIAEARAVFPATFIAKDLERLVIPYISPHSKSR
jgi:ribonuclease Z